ENAKEIARQETKVAGERALTIQLEMKAAGVKGTLQVTVFVHQGIAYEVLGARVLGDAKEFDKDLASILDSFSFLEERREWLAKYKGRPAPNTLLGGLVSFELNRPRWTETTFEGGPEYSWLDYADYKFFPGGAWIYLRVQRATGDAAAELESLRHTLSARVQNAKAAESTVKGRTGEIPCIEITGNLDADPYVMRAAAAVEEGLAVHIWMESVHSQREVTRGDWEQILGSFRLQPPSKPDQPPAFSVRKSYENFHPDPGLAVFLAKAKRVVAHTRLD